MITTIVAETSCWRPGQSTLRSSATHSPTNARKPPRFSRFCPVWLFGWPVGLTWRERERERSGCAGAWKSLRRALDERAT